MKRSNISCAAMRRHLCSELDEGLNSARCRALKKHIKNCPGCAAYLTDLKKTVQLYRRYPDVRIGSKKEQQILLNIIAIGAVKQNRKTRKKKKNTESKA